MFVQISMSIAEERGVGIDAEWTYQGRGRFTFAAWPHNRFVACKQANRRAADRTLSFAYQFTGQCSRAAEIVLVFHLACCVGERASGRGAHRQFAPANAERAHMSTAFQPQLAQQQIYVTQWDIRPGLDDEPVARRARWAETEDNQRLRRADFVVRSGAGLEVGHHFCFRRAVSAQPADARVC